jgi:hypothetical protein
MKNRLLCLSFLFNCVVTFTQAQTHCVTSEVAAFKATIQPSILEKRQAISHIITKKLAEQPNSSQERTVVTIPVVVHVVFSTNNENISDAQINSQIDVLNTDFRKMNANAANIPADFASLAADVEIEFCLASIDPNGLPTSGIEKRSTTITNISMSYSPDGRTKVCHNSLGGFDAWDDKKYLNFWVAKIGSGILGYATFPGTAMDGEDGVFIDARYFGKTGLASQNPPNHLGRTAVHELGHYFDLRHIWGDNSNVCTDDDGVDDTPIQRTSYEGCPTHPQLSCGNKAMFMNYMDYTVDGCMSMFTEGQKARMLATLQTTRSGLLSSNGCGMSPSFEPINRQNLSILPNPVDDYLMVTIHQSGFEPQQYVVYDIIGKQILRGHFEHTSTQRIDVSGLLSGAYVLQIEGKKGFLSQKSCFLKQ